MGNAVTIKTELLSVEAEALLTAIRAQYRLPLNDLWYADQFRLVPDGLRHDSILASNPVMAAQKRLIGALTLSLKAAK